MLNKLKPKSEFTKNVLTLITGTTIAQAIPIAISPILTRLYTPEDFGVLALFVAITSIFGSIANGRYELAIMLPKKDEDAINIFAIGFIINILLSLLLLFLVIVFHDLILSFLDNNSISIWLYFIPLSVFLIGIFNLLNYYNNRLKNYQDLAKVKVIKSFYLAFVQILFGIFKVAGNGLILGRIISDLFSNIRLYKNIGEKDLFKHINKELIILMLKKYKQFPIYTMPATLLNSFSLYMINIVISTLFSFSILGFYSLSQRILGMPSVLIGRSIGQVFFKTATDEKHNVGSIKNIFWQTMKKLLFISIPMFLFLFFTVEELFSFIFGETWKIAGTYAQIIMPLFFVRFIVSPFTLIPLIYEKNHIDLLFQIGLLSSYIIVFILEHTSFMSMLYLLNYIVASYYILYTLYLIYFIKKMEIK